MGFADLIILGVMLFSALFALSRGFSREAVSLILWVSTAAATYFTFPLIRPYAHVSIPFGALADAVALFVVFFGFLSLLSYISSRLTSRIGGKPGTLDRSLGFAYGLARGLVFVAGVYWILGFTTYQSVEPESMNQASLLPLVDTTARTLETYFPMESRTYQMGLAAAPDNTNVSPESADEEEGYADSERRALDQLIESTSGD